MPTDDALLTIYVDVDDTFVRTAGDKRVPIPAVIKHIRYLKDNNVQLFCWSSGGADYARLSAEEFGLSDCFLAFLPKPNAILDHQHLGEWRSVSYIHPAFCTGRTVADYLRETEPVSSGSALDGEDEPFSMAK
jgi:hypothetical protein